MQKLEGKYILALETAIDGGSVSILADEVEVDFVKGNQNLSKSEDLLTLLDDLLTRNKINKNQIGLIAVSIGAGSLTGLRIGKAIALGLGNSLNIMVVEVNFFAALYQTNTTTNYVFSAVYAGKDKVLYKEKLAENSEIQTLLVKEFAQKYDSWKMIENASAIVSENLQSVLTEDDWNKIISDSQTQIVEGSLAKLIGLKGKAIFASDNE
jgi:tRNA threonylcarbamoyl adenosine modification protein YeaZ